MLAVFLLAVPGNRVNHVVPLSANTLMLKASDRNGKVEIAAIVFYGLVTATDSGAFASARSPAGRTIHAGGQTPGSHN